MSHKEVALKIEHFYNDEDLEFRISSKREMLFILQNIADHGTSVALFYGSGQSSVLTTLLGANGHGMWLDVGPFPPENKQLLLSKKVTFVSLHQHVKVQFVTYDIESDLYENKEAFFLGLPEYLLRIQRREYFRTAIPSNTHVRCIIPIQPENPDDPPLMRAIQIMDISGGGVALVCETRDTELLPGNIDYECSISLPDVGTISVTIIVKNAFEVTLRNGDVCKRAGCEFSCLSGEAAALLQRYVVHLQSETWVKSA